MNIIEPQALAFHIKGFKKRSLNPLQTHNFRLTNGVRPHKNHDINESLSHTNIILENNIPEGATLLEAVERDIQQSCELTRKIRKDAIFVAEAIVSAPKGLTPYEERDFYEKIIDYFKKKLGYRYQDMKSPVIYAVVHKDESNIKRLSHMHIGLSCINSKHKLSYSSIYNKAWLFEVHDELSRALSEYGIVRGEDSRETGKKIHSVDLIAFKNQTKRDTEKEVRRYNELLDQNEELTCINQLLKNENLVMAEKLLEERDLCLSK